MPSPSGIWSDMKTCTKCEVDKPFESFSKKKDGLQNWCRECFAQYRKDNREHERARLQAYREANREKFREYDRKNHRAKTLKKYGLTEPEYEALVLGQDSRCAICGKVPNDRLVVDHNHETGQVRGLLCRSCNSALGLLGESEDVLLAAYNYVFTHNRCVVDLL